MYFEDEDVQVRVECPKEVTWNQLMLSLIVDRITASGEDPTAFVEVHYSVNERKYKAWPASLKASFASARTVTLGQSTFYLQARGGELMDFPVSTDEGTEEEVS